MGIATFPLGSSALAMIEDRYPATSQRPHFLLLSTDLFGRLKMVDSPAPCGVQDYPPSSSADAFGTLFAVISTS
jgi:hypothetical protein